MNENAVRGRLIAHAYWDELEKISGAERGLLSTLGTAAKRWADNFAAKDAGIALKGGMYRTAENATAGTKMRAFGANALATAANYPKITLGVLGAGTLGAGFVGGRATS